jgi:hypothetical protein
MEGLKQVPRIKYSIVIFYFIINKFQISSASQNVHSMKSIQRYQVCISEIKLTTSSFHMDCSISIRDQADSGSSVKGWFSIV